METNYTFICHNCQCSFQRSARQSYKFLHTREHIFCSKKCNYEYRSKSITMPCGYCQKQVTRTNAEYQKSKSNLVFCNHSCAASYNNKLKRKSCRSKCEILLCQLIVKEFPQLTILPNDKTMLQGLEVDIAIPELHLAIEWNGIVHFKPIYGQDKLLKIQNIDKNKLELASNLNIRLIVIPDLVSNTKYVEQSFENIKQIINELINCDFTTRT